MATVNFTSEQIAPGFAGLIDTTRDPLRIYGASIRTVWAGHITGSDAVLTATSNFGANNNLVEVSIDGSPFVSADHVGADYTLFSGLPDQSRFVAIRYGSAFATAPYVLADSNALLTVTGAEPAVLPFSHWAELRDGNPLTAFSAMTAAAPENYSPAYIAATTGNQNGSNVSCIKLRGTFNQLATVCNTSAIYISKNGAAPVRYDRPEEASGSIFCFLAENLGGDLATYHVWSAGSSFTQFSVSGDAPLVDCGTKRRLDQYGDSITDGSTAGAGRGEVDTMKVAARLGFVGSTSGVSGHTTAQCNTLLDTVLPGRVISSQDVAILAIGRNDTGGGLPQAEYESCISKLLSAGYGTVLCRGVIPGSNEVPWTAFNTNIQSVVSGLSDSRVVYIDTDDWVGLSFSDATHPDAAGYDVMTEYAVISYSDALDITPPDDDFEITDSPESIRRGSIFSVTGTGITSEPTATLAGEPLSVLSYTATEIELEVPANTLAGHGSTVAVEITVGVDTDGFNIEFLPASGFAVVDLVSPVGGPGTIFEGMIDADTSEPISPVTGGQVIYSEMTSGGASPYPVTVRPDGWPEIDTGGATLDGSEVFTFQYLAPGEAISNSVVVSLADYLEPFEFTGSGGITVGGTADLFHAFAATGSGGVTIGGSAEYSFPTAEPFEFTGTGGLVFSGSADYSGPTVEPFDFTGSGGLSVGGSADIDTGAVTILPPSGLVVIIDTSDQVIQSADRPLDPYDTEWVVFAWDDRIADATVITSEWVLPTDWNLVRTAQNQEFSTRGRAFQAVNAALVDVNNAVAGRYVVSNRVHLSDGRQFERSVKIKIREM